MYTLCMYTLCMYVCMFVYKNECLDARMNRCSTQVYVSMSVWMHVCI